jgi:hypothetical protein
MLMKKRNSEKTRQTEKQNERKIFKIKEYRRELDIISQNNNKVLLYSSYWINNNHYFKNPAL